VCVLVARAHLLPVADADTITQRFTDVIAATELLDSFDRHATVSLIGLLSTRIRVFPRLLV